MARWPASQRLRPTAPPSTGSARWLCSSLCGRRASEIANVAALTPSTHDATPTEARLQCAGPAHPLDNVLRRTPAQLVADAVHHAADQQAIEAQPDRPQQQCAASAPPGQAE